MARRILAILAFFCFVPAATAMLSPQTKALDVERPFLPALLGKKETSSPEQAPRLRITATTNILLDGQPCKMEDLPEGVEIVLLKVAADKKTVQAIHFRSKK